jgi:RNA polymerase sigma-70 factor (ECF subfamily)
VTLTSPLDNLTGAPGARASEMPLRRVDPLATLARHAAAGDAAAQRALCESLGPVILSVLRSLVGASSPEIADLLQESLIGVLHGLPTFRAESSVTHYACCVAMKRALDARRRARVVAHAIQAVSREPPPPGPELPGEQLISHRLRGLLGELVQELPEPQAETLLLRVVLGHSVAEIAEATRVPLNTVRSRLLVAKKALRERILAEPALCEMTEARS